MKLFKILSLLLVMLITVTSLASCFENSSGKESSTPSGQLSSPTENTPGSTPEATPEVTPQSTPESTPPASSSSSSSNPEHSCPPVTLDKEMNLLVGTLYYDEWLDTDDGEIVGTELYNRVLRVEHNLSTELIIDKIPSKGGDRESVLAEVKKRNESTDPNIIAHLVSTYSQFAGAITLEGRYQDINNSDYIDLDNPWWPDDLMNNSNIDGKIYFVSGDISPTLIYETYAIFFNNTLLQKYAIENPIDLVNNHQWTFDKLIELTSDIYDDSDNITGLSEGDFFAFNFNDNAHIKAFPFAMGIRVIEPDEDDGYVFSDSYLSQKMEGIADKMSDWFTSNPGVNNSNEVDLGYNTFKNQNCIFTVGNFAYAAFYINGLGIDYGVVPCPLYDTEQEQYYSYYGNPTSFWGVPNNVDIDDSALLLEYLGADAYTYISPALFERALKFKYISGEIDGLSHMFDIIRDGLMFDACMFYNKSIGAAYNEFLEVLSQSSWIGQFNGFKLSSMKGTLKGVVSKLRNLKY